MRVVLFGGSGFIGRHVRAALEADPAITEVVCTGRDRHDLIAGSAADLTELLRAEAPQAVVSCVGALGGSDEDLVRANTLVAAKLLEASGPAAPRARLVRLGSAGEYGVVAHGHAVTEDDRLEPVGAYGVSHVAGTRLFTLAGESGRADAVSVRVFNPIGPGQPGENVLGRAAQRIREARGSGASVITLGPLGAYRDFVDVRDVASLLRAIVVAPRVRHRVYNAGSGRAVTVREAVGALVARAAWKGAVREAGAGPQRSAAVDWIQADISRAGAEFGWKPAHDLASSIAGIWDNA